MDPTRRADMQNDNRESIAPDYTRNRLHDHVQRHTDEPRQCHSLHMDEMLRHLSTRYVQVVSVPRQQAEISDAQYAARDSQAIEPRYDHAVNV